MERKKRSKGSVWEFCYASKIFGTFGDEIRALWQKLVKFCAHTNTHTHTRGSISSKDGMAYYPKAKSQPLTHQIRQLEIC